jgi:acetylornithine deacetylase/succinyl-diaminopimelate desuccinylase-like protein
MRFALLPLFVSLLCTAAEPDWKSIEAETLEHYSALVRLDTTNPPGNETRAVEYLTKILDKEGIPYSLLGTDPKRQNLIARLKGSGAKKPILLMGHTDTVGIDPKKWKHGPFSAHREGGYIYGRGTNDDKDSVATYLMVLLTLKRLNVPLDRDVIFFAEAAEETGAATWGAGWVVDKHFDQVDCEYCLAEGGGFRREGGKLIANMVGTAEKIPRGIRLVAKGAAGHGSRPEPGNAVLALTEAVAKIGRWLPPMRLSDTTRAYFERMAAISPPEQAARFNAVVHPEKGPEVFAWFQKNDPCHFAMLTNTITPTILRAGYQLNVIPSEAEATIDIRMLPGEDTEAFYNELRKVINNPQVEVVARGGAMRPTTPPSRIDNEMWKALESVQAKLFPGLRAIPVLGVGATDKSYFRAKGVQCYGIGPAIDVEDAALGFGAHSDQERMNERSLHEFVRFAWGVVNEIAARR